MSDERDLVAKRVAISSALLAAYFIGGIAVGVWLGGLGLDQTGWLLGMALYASVVGISWDIAKRTRFGKYLWEVHTFWV